MAKRDTAILLLDGLINLALGLPLVFFPQEVAAFLGLPVPQAPFYASMLGAVLAGIGLALIIQCRGTRLPASGLGLGGALSINLCAAAVLAVWLAVGELELAPRGSLFLWAVVLIVGCLSAVELSLFSRRVRR